MITSHPQGSNGGGDQIYKWYEDYEINPVTNNNNIKNNRGIYIREVGVG